MRSALLATIVVLSGALISSAAWGYSARVLIRATGAGPFDGLGNSVSAAGDVNGDGYDDVIMGVTTNDAGGDDAGRAYVYYGGPGADDVADLTFTGAAAFDWFGVASSGAGDVNGDGYADVIVGAFRNDSGGVDAGRAYVFYGGSGADSVADLTLTGEAAGDEFGRSVSGAGDMNGDGYADVIVGAPGNDAGGGVAGRAYVYYGGPGGDAVADLVLTGAATGDFFGGAVSDAGDVNGDAYADVIVGAVGSDAGGTDAGRAYVYHGGPGADVVADVILTGAPVQGQFGVSVSGAGDVNGDGYADLIVGAHLNDIGGTGKGNAFVIHGGPGGDNAADLILTGTGAADFFGVSVSGAGDVNKDGYADVIVGAHQSDAGGTDGGGAFVYFGGPGADAVADLALSGVAGDALGGAVSGAGDVNGDGYDDVIVAAQFNDAGGFNAGQVTVYTARPYEVVSPNGGEQWIEAREHTVRWLGADLADLWISLDGGASYSLLASGVGGGEENEMEVTAPTVVTSGAKVRVSASGEAVTHSSSDASDATFGIVAAHDPPAAAHRLSFVSTGTNAADMFGSSVSGAGDVNGDGYADVIVGAIASDPGGIKSGSATVTYGGPGADAVADLTLIGAAVNDFFGASVSGAGDVNGDGYADVIVGAYGNDAGGSLAGRAYLYHGGPAADAVADLILTGVSPGDRLGISVSGAGDVNGDGYADVVVGASGSDAGGMDAGRAYVFYGGPSADAVADITLTGASSGDLFGFSVSGAGDVNGDGYADVIVGAYGNDAANDGAGRAYVYYGRPGADAVADLTLTGASAFDSFGWSVSGAGDVNGDGYADVIVAAPQLDPTGLGPGRAYVYLGGTDADVFADLTLTGEAAGDLFGTSVSGAGDVNEDGYADLIVGASENDAAGTGGGRAYVYYGGPGADALPDVILTGSAAGDQFGSSVSSVQDRNEDGYAYVIVGAPGNDTAGSDAGRADVYDCDRYFVLTPNGGETWNVGAMKTISWLGAEPADLWLSVDGGDGDERLASHVGGAVSNTIALRVPHFPTKFARVLVRPSDSGIPGEGRSDSLFTIQTSIALLSLLAAPMPEGGVSVTWGTNPGPEDLMGYRLERSGAGTAEWRTVVSLTRETTVSDPEGGPGSRYRLFAVNGFGDELWLGESSIRPLAALAAWPLPYRGGTLTISFATAGGLGGGSGRAELSVYDVGGRLVRRIDSGAYPAGHRVASWDGRDQHGRDVAPGVYFLRTNGDLGYQRTMKVSVLR